MTTFFDSLQLGSITLSNRIIMAPMTRGRANEVGVQPAMAATYYAQRAAAGLIITESVHISPMAKANEHTPGIYTVAQIESWRAIADAVHARGGKIFMQLLHAGRLTLPELLPGNAQPVAPSAVKPGYQIQSKQGLKDPVTPRALSIEEIKQVTDEYVTAAVHAMAAGMDGVELHAGYGYLPHQFLGSNTNLRSDQYGMYPIRFVLETTDAICTAIGSLKVGVRITPGVTHHDMEEARAAVIYPQLVNELNHRRLAYLHVVQDATGEISRHLRVQYGGTYLLNGGFTRESGAEILSDGLADAIVYGKPFIANPDLPERFRRQAALNSPDFGSFYTSGARGYTDYQPLSLQ